MLSSIKLAIPEIKLAVVELDDGKLTIDDLKAIGSWAPTADEIRQLSGKTDLAKLPKVDQYVAQVSW
jgi:diaphanous 1